MSRELKFTVKEKKILKMVVEGKTCQEMVDRFGNSLGRIHDIRATMLRKTGFKNMSQLSYFAGINKIV